MGIDRALSRMTHEIVERNHGVEGLVLIGIRTAGVYLSERIASGIETIEGLRVPTGIIDVTLYRDDLALGRFQPAVRRTEIPFTVDGKKVVLVDDVFFTGRTIRAAMDVLIDFGRPSRIELAVLIDRGHRELPISPDFVGMNVTTTREESVIVRIEEIEGSEEAVIERFVNIDKIKEN
jgi:pyrimidine operon attenuation protein/uracil phosphoribosyltransferase